MTAPTMIAADRILAEFQKFGGTHSATMLATNLGLPYPTVRRAVQDLRRDGFIVTYRRDLGGYTFDGVTSN